MADGVASVEGDDHHKLGLQTQRVEGNTAERERERVEGNTAAMASSSFLLLSVNRGLGSSSESLSLPSRGERDRADARENER